MHALVREDITFCESQHKFKMLKPPYEVEKKPDTLAQRQKWAVCINLFWVVTTSH